MHDIRPVLMPKARKDQLIIKELPNETLVYDQDTNQAHCLNSTASRVWKECDGKKPITDITAALQEAAGAPVDEAVVWLALDQLEKFKLLDAAPVQPQVFAGMSRRQLMRGLSVAAVALPVIVSIIAPTPAATQSCVNPGGRAPGVACGSNNQCCSGTCCTTVVPGCPNNTCL